MKRKREDEEEQRREASRKRGKHERESWKMNSEQKLQENSLDRARRPRQEKGQKKQRKSKHSGCSIRRLPRTDNYL